MATETLINLWLLGAVLMSLAGLNAPLGALALALTASGAPLVLRPELAWTTNPEMLWVWSALLVLQFLADLYFVPATVRDHLYLQQSRTVNAYLHARVQSLYRPLVAALVLAALPLPLASQTAAVLGFIWGTTVYWATAWVREQVATSRGSVFLLLVEMAKNVIALGVAVIAPFTAPLALGLLGFLVVPIALWAGRLRREQLHYPAYGVHIASEDS